MSENVDLDDISSDDLESTEKCSKVQKKLHFRAIFPYFDVPQVIFIFSKKDFYCIGYLRRGVGGMGWDEKIYYRVN